MYIDNELGTQMVRWRHQLHQFPETGFNEHKTANFIANALELMGMQVHRGIGGTGLVASLTVGEGKGVIGLRADMDALAMTETAQGRPYISRHTGCMHGCGHDGHMAMLLGAAQSLTRTRDFNGTVRFIFQPAEEHGRGANAMIGDGLFDRFPVDQIYGAHNIPGLPAGHIATRAGGIMASEDNFVIRIHGRGGHAARPHMAIDPLLVAAEIILALQTIVARAVDPADPAVLSCTEIHSDGIRNAIPGNVEIKGDTRSYSPHVQALLERRMREICHGIAAAHGASCEVEYTHEFVPTVNWPECTSVAVRAAQAVVGIDNVDGNVAPMMISEDFGAFLKVVPGAFVFIGNGIADAPGGVPLHNAKYDFNDAILPIGARYFAELVRQRLLPAC
ncbi:MULTISPECIES: M20 aminoacylase family protein [unclassified Janthinobacterium]|uniref:M20 aminoacylase family protein n=1 Tax=unclassified Janthinobacterium TaxID=2610881 RepID=UPI0003479DF5|nr:MULTISPECIES: M20 aminoacylase family protein [unclassified Janthinobacterium]MEC5163134.1 amidohydrolase [Janthinobacterium sp. CG_S6]